MTKFPYSEKVLEHFKNPRNTGKIEDADGKGVEGSAACGDMIAVYLKVDQTSKKITDIKFESYGCASNIATSSIITELAMGKTLDEAKAISWQQASDELGGLPSVKAHCSVLAVDGLRSAIADYEERHGIKTEKRDTTSDTVVKRLQHVMNPKTGTDVVRTKLVKDIQVAAGKVTLRVELPPDNRFANAIREDIQEKLEGLWDVNQVNVEFIAKIKKEETNDG
jgi:nitrogen fixation NifU-like protein